MSAKIYLVLRKPFIEGEETTWSIIDESPSRAEAKRLAIIRREDNAAGDIIVVTCIDNVTRIEKTTNGSLWVVRQKGNVVKADNAVENWLMAWELYNAGWLVEASKYVKKERLISTIAAIMRMVGKVADSRDADMISTCEMYMAGNISKSDALVMIKGRYRSNRWTETSLWHCAMFLLTEETVNLSQAVMPIVYSMNEDLHNDVKHIIKETIPLPVMLLSRIGPGQDLL